ncbi:photosystem II assembly family protein [Anthocerotibacter panamensis]|uniref:photosystem II assembly family protein n=1 Tax=Anthocerotibacter panamensis TaxID=2857077 RepID=UPI001C40323B|nr:photosystem II assembly family protein [Anthocerotibacter panamensis]
MDSWTPERKATKRAEMRAALSSPYRSLRLFLYLCFAGSGVIGTLVFLSRTLGGLAKGNYDLWVNSFFMALLHVVLVVTMVVLFRAEREREIAQTERFLRKQK